MDASIDASPMSLALDDAPCVAINGFGRIGRLVLRALFEAEAPVNVVAVNDLSSVEMLAHLLRNDSIHGRFPAKVRVDGDTLLVDRHPVRALREPEPARLPWQDLGAALVIDATGKFRTREALEAHVEAGADRVLLTSPGKDVDVSIVRGVNDGAYDPAAHRFISNSSCTTNCLAPVLKVLDDAFGVEHAVMTTVHAYTNSQRLLDAQSKDPRRARAAAINMIPTTTGAAKAIGLVMPRLSGRVSGMCIRVPTPAVSIVDLTAKLSVPVEAEDLASAFSRAAAGELQGILGIEDDPLVSTDFIHDPRSAVVDRPSLLVVDGSLVKVLAWYDNEWAYAMRTAEVALEIARSDATRSRTAVASR